MALQCSIFQIVLQPLRDLALGSTFLCALTGMALAQPARDARANLNLPQHAQENEWHFDPISHRAWVYKSAAWVPFPADNCRSVKLCNGHAIVKNGIFYMLAQENGTVVVEKAPAIHCMDALIVVGSFNRIEYLLDQAGDTVSALVDNCKIYNDTVQGTQVYCFPQYQQGLERYNCFDLRNWGMMDGAGKWVIAPKYDKPFKFRNGVAAVIYKGEHLRIDETGELLVE
jgi:hypothetical protein